MMMLAQLPFDNVPRAGALSGGEVHLWWASLALPPEVVSKLDSTLSAEERERARRFRREIDRVHFAAGRGLLRRLLACYLETDPGELAFVRDTAGKPRLSHPAGTSIRFNLSHSAGVVVFAVARAREVGVDIEHICHGFPYEGVARRVFSSSEQLTLAEIPENRRLGAFFQLWTRREAYLKGIGSGWVGSSPDQEVPFLSESIRPGRPAYGQWSIARFHLDAEYAATVAVEGTGVKIPQAARLLPLLSERL
jgi:4'-phosphopantetheinyl transferase